MYYLFPERLSFFLSYLLPSEDEELDDDDVEGLLLLRLIEWAITSLSMCVLSRGSCAAHVMSDELVFTLFPLISPRYKTCSKGYNSFMNNYNVS